MINRDELNRLAKLYDGVPILGALASFALIGFMQPTSQIIGVVIMLAAVLMGPLKRGVPLTLLICAAAGWALSQV